MAYNYLEDPLSEAINQVQKVPGAVAGYMQRGKENVQQRMADIAPAQGPARNRPDINVNLPTAPTFNAPDVSLPTTPTPQADDRFPRTRAMQSDVQAIYDAEMAAGRPWSARAEWLRGTIGTAVPAVLDVVDQFSPVGDFVTQVATGNPGQGNYGDRLESAIRQNVADYRAGGSGSDALQVQPTGTGGLTTADGRFIPAPASPGLLGNMERNAYGRTALEEFAEANRIRREGLNQFQSDLDASRARVREMAARAGGGPNPVESALERVQGLYAAADVERNPMRRSALLRQARGAEGDLAVARRSQDIASNNAADLERARLGAQGLPELRAAQAAAAMTPQGFDFSGAMNNAFKLMNDAGVDLRDADGNVTPEARDILRGILGGSQRYEQALETFGTQTFEDGGMVPEPVGSAVSGSLGSATPALPPMAAMQQYQQYASGAQSMGLPPVSFEEFIQMGAGPTPAPMSFADGGMVPDASGKMVHDADPNAPTDSIPALIDETQPARLDSGEFVMPKDVVLFFGTDKLQKMIAQARDTQNGGKSAVASATA